MVPLLFDNLHAHNIKLSTLVYITIRCSLFTVLEKLKIKLLSYSLFVVVPRPWAWGILDFSKSKPPMIVSSPRLESENCK
jgi:hypothetical protein